MGAESLLFYISHDPIGLRPVVKQIGWLNWMRPAARLHALAAALVDPITGWKPVPRGTGFQPVMGEGAIALSQSILFTIHPRWMGSGHDTTCEHRRHFRTHGWVTMPPGSVDVAGPAC